MINIFSGMAGESYACPSLKTAENSVAVSELPIIRESRTKIHVYSVFPLQLQEME